MELRSILNQYKEISLKLVKSIEYDDNNGELLIKKREELLTYLKENNFSKEELKNIADELELVQIEKKVMNSIVVAREEVKREMLELKRKREANRTYSAGFRNINFINKKI
jgi:phosphopantetheine adenylyltransferase